MQLGQELEAVLTCWGYYGRSGGDIEGRGYISIEKLVSQVSFGDVTTMKEDEL
ncbi:hypothetical protein PIB30_035972 [Stylosanthes scabra]|uniref:Uncharacterized protein n=1 Tax=Stylosanthes scabra TaxID=79078 RepID=A0ABU6SE37_9FABA|nr:hypothetical protein [Stylosanthes scabra]